MELEPMKITNPKEVFSLINHAGNAHDATEAMKFSQAALNIANTLSVMSVLLLIQHLL